MSAKSRSSFSLVLILLLSMISLPSVMADNHYDFNDIGNPNDVQAQEMQAVWDSTYEFTRVSWRNIGGDGGSAGGISSTTIQNLPLVKYRVYRAEQPIVPSDIENGNYTHFSEVDACQAEQDAFECLDQERSAIFFTSHSSNGSYHYAITTVFSNGTEFGLVEMNVSQNYVPVIEDSNPISTPFNLRATYDGDTSETVLEWDNTVPVFFPGQLTETGLNAYTIRIYEHVIPATRENWANINPSLVAIDLPAGTNSYRLAVPDGIDRDVYYTATLVDMGYEDYRMLTSNSLSEPLREDNRAPSPAIEVAASFSPDASSGFGTTRVVWTDDPYEDGNETYKIWRSSTPFGQNVSGATLVGSSSAGVELFDVVIDQGTLGESYYAVTISDWVDNHDGLVSSGSTSTLIFEDTFNPWIAEPTSVSATYMNGVTTVNWNDQMGAEGEVYHVYRSVGTRLTSASNLTLEAELIATVPDGVQTTSTSVTSGVVQTSYYCVTTEARYGYVNGTYEDTRFVQNCSEPTLEDTRMPNPAFVSEPQLSVLSSQKYILVSWINNIDETDETYSIWAHSGNPWGIEEWEQEDVLTSNVSGAEEWVLLMDNIEEPGEGTTTIYRNINLDLGIDQYRWYAITTTDMWGNENLAISSPGNVWRVHEDTTAPSAEITIEGEDDDGDDFIAKALTLGDYELLFKVNEMLSEDPVINVTTTDYDEVAGTGYAFTEQGGMVRAEPVPGRELTYRLRMTLPNGLSNADLHVEYTLVDQAGNTETNIVEGWPIDVQDPNIQMYSPGTSSTYLYGEYVRVHGSVSDDVGVDFVRIKFEKGLAESTIVRTEWFNVTDITALDDDGKIFVFEYVDPAASWPDKGAQKLIVQAGDAAGNIREISIIFTVDLCQRTVSGFTVCASSIDDLNPPDVDADGVRDDMDMCIEPTLGEEVDASTGCASPGLFSGTYILVYAMGGLNLVLLIAAILAASMANANPTKKRRGDEEDMHDEDDWMADFMSGGSAQGSPDDVRSDMASLNTKSEEKEEKQVEEEDDIFREKVSRPKRRTKKKSDSDDDDEDDDDDEESSRPRVRRRSVRRRSS